MKSNPQGCLILTLLISAMASILVIFTGLMTGYFLVVVGWLGCSFILVGLVWLVITVIKPFCEI